MMAHMGKVRFADRMVWLIYQKNYAELTKVHGTTLFFTNDKNHISPYIPSGYVQKMRYSMKKISWSHSG
jgi:hypothetical protein